MEVATKAVQLVFDVYQESDEQAVIDLLSRVFTTHDPLAVALKVEPDEFAGLLKWLSPKVAREGLTSIIRREDTREVVAVMFVEDAGTEPADGAELLSSKFDAIFTYLGGMEAEYRGENHPEPGHTAHFFFCGVDDEFASQGVSQFLLNEGIQHVFNQGYEVIVAEATSKKSKYISGKMGFVPKLQHAYADFEFEGKKVFESIAEEGGTTIMELVKSGFVPR